MPHLDPDRWLPLFAARLRALLPDMAEANVLGAAIETYRDASDMTPEEAAEIYAAELPPAEAGMPGD